MPVWRERVGGTSLRRVGGPSPPPPPGFTRAETRPLTNCLAPSRILASPPAPNPGARIEHDHCCHISPPMTGEPRARENHYRILDALRFVLALWVTIGHYAIFPLFAGAETATGFMRLLTRAMQISGVI